LYYEYFLVENAKVLQFCIALKQKSRSSP
jgi:hypothetical protein